MLELFSNFFLKDRNEVVPNVLGEHIHISINKKNFKESIHTSLEAYKLLNQVVITYDSPDVMNNFLSFMGYSVCNTKRISEIDDMLMINDCIFLN